MKRLFITIAYLFVAQIAGAQNYLLDWYTINSGGGRLQSSNYLVDFTLAEPIVGQSVSEGYLIQCGFSLRSTPGPGGCVYVPGDINGNGSANGIDVTYGVTYLKGGNAPKDSCDCPPMGFPFYAAMDVNGNCGANGIDVTYFVSYLKGQQSALLFCADCPPAGMMVPPPDPAMMPIVAPALKAPKAIKAAR